MQRVEQIKIEGKGKGKRGKWKKVGVRKGSGDKKQNWRESHFNS